MQSGERSFDLGALRTLRIIPAERWLGRPVEAFWGEWDHPLEMPRSFQRIVDDLEPHWKRFILPGSTCIDVGAHSGDTAIPMGLFCFDKGQAKPGTVIVVEPNPDLWPVLSVNLELNAHIANFISVKAAITNVDTDQVELADHGNASCNGGILSADSYSEELAQALTEIAQKRYFARGVSVHTLVNDMAPVDPRSISFIKTDCEGYDKEIIRGARDFLQQIKPTLFVEWFDRFAPADNDDLFNAISEVGYVALHPGAFRPVDRATERLSDLLCVPKDRAQAYS